MVGAGIYGDYVTVPAGVILRGTGRNLTKISSININAGSSLIDLETQSISSGCTHSSNIRIVNVITKSFSFTERWGCTGSSDIYITNSDFTNRISLPGAADVVLLGNRIQQSVSVGVRSIIKGNRFSNIAGGAGNEIALNGSETCIFSNNVIDRSGSTSASDILPYGSASCRVENNTFTARSDNAQGETASQHYNWKNNIFVTNATPPAIDANGNLVGDPTFVNAIAGDYHLATGSPAIDAGIGQDADGSKADIGAYGGVGAGVWTRNASATGQPEVSYVVVQPNPVSPGEPLRLRFGAQTH